MDFCFLFHFSSNGNYKETSKFIVDKIKKEDNKSQIKITLIILQITGVIGLRKLS